MEGMQLFDPISRPKIISSAKKLEKLQKHEKLVLPAGTGTKRKNEHTQTIGE